MAPVVSVGDAHAASPHLNGPTPAAAQSVKAAPSADVRASLDSKIGTAACAKAGDPEAGAQDSIAPKAEGGTGAKQIELAEEHKARQGCFSCGRRGAARTDKQQHSGCTMC